MKNIEKNVFLINMAAEKNIYSEPVSYPTVLNISEADIINIEKAEKAYSLMGKDYFPSISFSLMGSIIITPQTEDEIKAFLKGPGSIADKMSEMNKLSHYYSKDSTLSVFPDGSIEVSGFFSDIPAPLRTEELLKKEDIVRFSNIPSLMSENTKENTPIEAPPLLF